MISMEEQLIVYIEFLCPVRLLQNLVNVHLQISVELFEQIFEQERKQLSSPICVRVKTYKRPLAVAILLFQSLFS